MPQQHSLTPRTRRLIALASDIAQRYDSPKQWDLALLIAIMEDRDGIAGRILSYLGLSASALYKLLPPTPVPPEREDASATLAPAATIEQLLDPAVPVATEANMPQIGSEHLLVVMVRRPESAAGRALATGGITEARIREAADRLW
jgi:ATP-dependent Clp protease ATP-binding subunit ClpA